MEFPYGKASLFILLLALVTGGALVVASMRDQNERPDLIFATFTKEHAEAYKPAIAQFERENNCHIQLQVVNSSALQGRLQSALQVGAEVPDMVELLDGSMGFFCKGPIEDVGFHDLTGKLKSTGLYDRLVQNRFTKWSSRGHIFALPHDVHPVMLAYRSDLVKDLGIDINQLTTWDKFVEVGQTITRDKNGDGVIDQYMMDFPSDGGDALMLLLLQRGGGIFNSDGEVTFDSELAVDVVCWYVKQTAGDKRISFPAGWGQNFAQSVSDGLCLFYICPDWRTNQFQMDVPLMKGKLGLMPLPAWKEGGIRTSTWGGTGLAFPKQCRNFDLAWKLAMYLYYDKEQLGPRFARTNILPPLREAWSEPQFDEPREFFGGIKIGRAYANLADSVPKEQSSPYIGGAMGKFREAFANAVIYYKEHGESGLREYTRGELKRCADNIRTVIKRNVFIVDDATAAAAAEPASAGGGR